MVETTITLPRLGALREYWGRIPPLPVLMAAVHGVKIAPRVGSSEVITGKALRDMVKSAGGTLRG